MRTQLIVVQRASIPIEDEVYVGHRTYTHKCSGPEDTSAAQTALPQKSSYGAPVS